MRRVKVEFYEYCEMFLSVFPGFLGKVLRKNFYKMALRSCGSNFFAALRIRIQEPSNVVAGNNVHLNYGVWIAANPHKDGAVIFGNDILVGPYTIIHSGNHVFRNPDMPVNKQGFEFKTITICDDVWIAARCTILAGVTIGKGAVVAAGAVVNKDVPPYTIVAGVPARVVGYRK